MQRDTGVVRSLPGRLGALAALGLGIAGCGRLGFDPLGVEASDGGAGADATVDAPATAACSWASGPPFTGFRIFAP